MKIKKKFRWYRDSTQVLPQTSSKKHTTFNDTKNLIILFFYNWHGQVRHDKFK